MAAIAGGAVGALTIICMTAWLLSRVHKRREINPSSAKELNPERMLSPFPLGASRAHGPNLPTATPLPTPPPPAILPVTKFTSTDTAATLETSNLRPAAPRASQEDLSHEQADFDPTTLFTPTTTLSTPTSSPIISTASSSTLVRPRSNRCLNDEQVEFVAGLYRQRIPPPDVARIVETLLEDEESSGNDQASSSRIIPSDRQWSSPPAYDFKTPL